MTKLAPVSHKMSISASLLNFRSSTMAYFEGISVPSENFMGNRLDSNVGRKYWKKTLYVNLFIFLLSKYHRTMQMPPFVIPYPYSK